MARKTSAYLLRLDPVKKAVWEAAARDDKLPLAAFVTKATDAAVEIVHRGQGRFLTTEELEAFDAMREQLRRAGVNLNVLLRTVHLFEDGAADRLPELEELRSCRDQLAEALSQITGMLQVKG